MDQGFSEPTEPAGSARRLVFELPEQIPILESELYAIEILLGNGLKELLASDADRKQRKS